MRVLWVNLLSLDEPGALGHVFVVPWAVGQEARGSRQPRGHRSEAAGQTQEREATIDTTNTSLHTPSHDR